MDRIKKGDCQVTTNQQEIIKEQVRCYSDKYRKTADFQEPSAQACLDGRDVPRLSDEQKTNTDGALTEEDLTRALKRMKNGSSSGLDGITTAFINFFWCKVKDMVLNSLNAAFTKGEMSITQKRAVITLIHKGKQLPRDDLNNWRPISLTNSDYKLSAKSLAIRVPSVISSIVNEDQVRFLKGRNISTVIRLIDDTINYLDKSERPGLLLALDYKAAFDTISKEYRVWAFKRFSFGENFVKWMEVLMKNTESCINYMGWLSQSIEVSSGIRQGCPFSPVAFILALELLAIKIRADPSVEGISVPRNHKCFLKLLLYADDITPFLQDRNDLKYALSLVSYLTNFSGLAINRNKTEAMWLG